MVPSLLQLRFLDRVVPLRGVELLAGRSMYCTIIVGDPSVSRVHAILSRQDGQTLVHDLGSKNGTRLNGSLVGGQPVPLREGDVLQIGEVKCEVERCDSREIVATTERPTRSPEDTTETFVGDLWKKTKAEPR